MKTPVVCCVCKKHLRWIDTPYGGVSDGYCKKHFEEAMQKADDAFRRDEALHQQEEPAEVTPLGPQEPPDDPMIYNRRQTNGTFRPLAGFWERDEAPPTGE